MRTCAHACNLIFTFELRWCVCFVVIFRIRVCSLTVPTTNRDKLRFSIRNDRLLFSNITVRVCSSSFLLLFLLGHTDTCHERSIASSWLLLLDAHKIQERKKERERERKREKREYQHAITFLLDQSLTFILSFSFAFL
jgi:hypothetical protein